MQLKANWKKLVMANYQVDPEVLTPFLPYGTQLDFFSNKCYVSLIGFMFLDSRFGGIPIPFHQSFEEVNLRFYIYRDDDGEIKRGVVFIKELVPVPLVALVADIFYRENYHSCPMWHAFNFEPDAQSIEYKWHKKKWHTLKIVSDVIPNPLIDGSAESFFTEHYFGYTKINDQLTLEYDVIHGPWKVYDTKEFIIDVDFETCYGAHFAFLNQAMPESVFLAEGSDIILQKGRKIKA